MLYALAMYVVYSYDVISDISVEVVLICDDSLSVQVVAVDLSDNRLVEGRVMIVFSHYHPEVGVMQIDVSDFSWMLVVNVSRVSWDNKRRRPARSIYWRQSARLSVIKWKLVSK